LRPRPRQNVVFELGFFIGRLGREKTVVLCERPEEIEILSDYSGVQYISMSAAGDWRKALLIELSAAGVPVG
jgi:predicted nucleotide-binding protein